ncbi:hypothetical protein [Fulvivirga lutea]|uniref:Lipocalin-like domain-containing protein n=1 Tax=Fulvivirga lutea TaxID=2810512 RepID=A0A974WJH8_9BACT|nr:hypothetical protein [Fulvivirga lutea]QSE99094.1 hypothetical protein JR347_08405 [Fulvivirga lutea]
MKKLSYLLSAAVLSLLLFSVGCDSGGDDGAPAVDQVGNTFSGTWAVDATQTGQVTFGSPSQDRTDDYSDFALTITYTAGSEGGTASIVGGPSGVRPFLGTDSWTFTPVPTDASTTQFTVTRASDGLQITVTNFSATGMTLSFSLADGGSTSRTEAVVGSWTFNLVKQ